MNPSSQKASPTLVRDINPPATVNAEIVSDIPVQSPIGTNATNKPQSGSNPVAKVFKPTGTSTQALEDKVMDHILKDVNTSVKQAGNTIEERFEHLSGVRKKAAVKKAQIQETQRGSPPIIATILACLVALALTAAAFYVYRGGY